MTCEFSGFVPSTDSRYFEKYKFGWEQFKEIDVGLAESTSISRIDYHSFAEDVKKARKISTFSSENIHSNAGVKADILKRAGYTHLKVNGGRKPIGECGDSRIGIVYSKVLKAAKDRNYI